MSWISSHRDRHPETPPWTFLALATVAFGVLFVPMAFASPSLYFYVFPLFGIGVTYVLQFRSELSLPWKVGLVATTILSIVALALNWPFSGHVLWNVLFIGHARRWGGTGVSGSPSWPRRSCTCSR